MSRFVKLLATVGTALCLVGGLHATGYFGPHIYLDDGGKNVAGSPEFYWGLEVRRISRDFHPPEKFVVSKEAAQKTEEEELEERTKKTSENTTETDLKDFDSAVQEARIKPTDAAKAKEQHKQARGTLDATVSGTPKPLPAEFDSEFADYHKGAAAYLAQQWDQARAAWENLLKRPEQDRHYRTVWAAFMLGKVALKEKDFPKATQWFQRTRELAKAGFADSLGLAAESYGWEGRAEWKQDHPEKAAALFMNQLALGERGDFVQALDVLFKGPLWEDAAFVAERVLTTNELKQYVDALPKTEPPKEGEDYNKKLRYLLGRRLVREDRYADAKQYLPPPYDKILEKYVKALEGGANEKLSKTERAHAWFTAAWLARYDGMELMGTEGAPDAFAEGGSFEMPDLAKERRSGAYQTVAYDKEGKASYDENGNPKMKNVPAFLKPSAKEVQRLNTNKIAPDIRFHYRLIAGALAIKAAALLPNNSEELADLVNTAGLWVKDRDEKTGNRYMQIIERRCAKTKIGKAAIAKHWFVDENGPWSTAEEQAYQAMHKELEPDRSE